MTNILPITGGQVTELYNHQGGQRWAKAGEKFYCNHCNSLVFVLAVDVHSGELQKISHLDQTQGQAPFFAGQEQRCKNCGRQYLINTMRRGT